MNRKTLAALIGIHQAAMLLAGPDDIARALTRWQAQPSLASLLHLATCGLFLAEDVAALG